VSARAARLLANRSRDAVFLCWHSIARDGPPFLSLPPELFERQLALLRDRGLRGGGTDDLAALADGRRLDAPRAFLTFDDGFADNFTDALPLLERYGFRALIYVLPPLLDEGAPLGWPELAEQRARHPGVMRSMDWAMVERMAEAGHEIGSHTLTHPHLDRLDPEPLRQELLDARRRLAERLGSCRTIAYPFGDWSPAVARSARDAGYEFAFTLPGGAQRRADRWSIPRVAVDHRDEPRRLRAKLTVSGRRVLLSPARDAARRLARR
jgi:peptidoglycan/xylan/chitin deacetylase (PgdA/CDA1 family)